MLKPKISIIFVTNRKGSTEFLKKELDKQTLRDFEVIVADDGQNTKSIVGEGKKTVNKMVTKPTTTKKIVKK